MKWNFRLSLEACWEGIEMLIIKILFTQNKSSDVKPRVREWKVNYFLW